MLDWIKDIEWSWFAVIVTIWGFVNWYFYDKGYRRGYKEGGFTIVNEWKKSIRDDK